MYLSALRLFRSLSRYHYRTIIITTLLPVIGTPVIAYFGPDSLVLRFVLYVGAFLVWSVFAVLAVASMLRRDRSEAEQLASLEIEALSGQISRLREEHEESRMDHRQQANDLEEVVRSTFEELGVVLPPRRISIRAKGIHFGIMTSVANVSVSGGSKVTRLRRWFRRVKRRLREVVYGKPEDSEDN